jgi:hypothetical protein
MKEEPQALMDVVDDRAGFQRALSLTALPAAHHDPGRINVTRAMLNLHSYADILIAFLTSNVLHVLEAKRLTTLHTHVLQVNVACQMFAPLGGAALEALTEILLSQAALYQTCATHNLARQIWTRLLVLWLRVLPWIPPISLPRGRRLSQLMHPLKTILTPTQRRRMHSLPQLRHEKGRSQKSNARENTRVMLATRPITLERRIGELSMCQRRCLHSTVKMQTCDAKL